MGASNQNIMSRQTVVDNKKQCNVVFSRHLLQARPKCSIFNVRWNHSINGCRCEFSVFHLFRSQEIETRRSHKQRNAILLVACPLLVHSLHALSTEPFVQPLKGLALNFLQSEHVSIEVRQQVADTCETCGSIHCVRGTLCVQRPVGFQERLSQQVVAAYTKHGWLSSRQPVRTVCRH
eukprot:scaffold61219_cov38-Tisochrysis_lutea.AAC.1